MQARKETRPEIVIVGGGPVGLCTAIQLREEKKDIPILIIEKNIKYLRFQRLKLDITLIKNKQLRNKIIEKGKKLDDHHIEIPIQDLENCLVDHAKKLGIEISYKQFLTEEQYQQKLKEHKAIDCHALQEELKQEIIVGIDSIKKNYPQCKIVIGADGSRSAVRETIVDEKADDSVSKTDLRNMIELKYQVKGKAEKLSTITFYLTQALLDGFLCSESISYNKEKDTSEITLRFLVDSETYNDSLLKGVNVKNLLPLHRHNIPAKLYRAINQWLNTRDDHDVIIESPTLNKTKLSIYTSKKYAGEVRDLPVLLIGDASCGFPFMNGLNLGIKNSKKLTDLISAEWHHIKKDEHTVFERLIKSYTEKTAETYQQGSSIVAKANRKIDYQESSVQLTYYSTFPIKGSMRYMRSGEHEIFSAHELLKFKAFDSYKKNLTPKTNKHRLCCDLETELHKAGRDINKIKKVLYCAYLTNKEIEYFTNKNWMNWFIGSYMKHQPKGVLDEKEIMRERLSTEIPPSLDISWASQDLHQIIYNMYNHAIKFESSLTPSHSSNEYKSLRL